jgi:predicted ATP-dependent endonuclease of OLD family
MKIKSITVENYKSIRELTIPLQSYGREEDKSQTTFLIGVNESGKSNILEAINLLNKYDFNIIFPDSPEKIEYKDYGKDFHKGSEKGDIKVSADIELLDMGCWRQRIVEKINCLEDFADNIQIVKLQKCISINSEGQISEKYNIEINEDFPFSQFKEYNKEIELIESSDQGAKQFLECKIADSLKEDFRQQMPQIHDRQKRQITKTVWFDLIEEPVDLSNFEKKHLPSFKNMFLIYGKNTNDEIRETIDKIKDDAESRKEFEKEMDEKVTEYINNIWKEHKIEISVVVNWPFCEVHIKDNDMKYDYSMSQRSDGFKQFMSLLLSFSAENKCKALKNNIILIDEPELHLHPSAIKDMRKELINLGKNNHVIVATHSNYMVDTAVPERHWIVKKEKGETTIDPLGENSDFYDDEVLYPAFGLNFFKELLPENIIVVEGITDKNIFSHAIRLFKPALSHSVKHTDGAGNCPNYARILNKEKINAFFIFDADKEGRNKKNSILNNPKDNCSDKNVFTLKDILDSLPDNATIEDLLPVKDIEKFYSKEMPQYSFNLNDESSIITQLKDKCKKEDKKKIDSLKTRLAEEFYNEYKTWKDIEDKAPKLANFIKCLCDRIND